MPSEPQIKRVVAFVDGQALFYAARYVFGYRQANYDVSALANAICKQQGWKLIQTRFYTGVPSVLKDAAGSNFWKIKLRQMRSQGVHIFSRELIYKKRSGQHSDGETEADFVPQEKGVDI